MFFSILGPPFNQSLTIIKLLVMNTLIHTLMSLSTSALEGLAADLTLILFW